MEQVEVLETKSLPRRIAGEFKAGIESTAHFINRYKAVGATALALVAANVAPASANEHSPQTKTDRVRVYDDPTDLLSGHNQIRLLDIVPKESVGLDGDMIVDGSGGVCLRGVGLAGEMNTNGATGMMPRIDMLQNVTSNNPCDRFDIGRVELSMTDADIAKMRDNDPNSFLKKFGNVVTNAMTTMPGYDHLKYYLGVYEGATTPNGCGFAEVSNSLSPTYVPSLPNIGLTYIHKQNCDIGKNWIQGGFSYPDVGSFRNLLFNFGYKTSNNPDNVLYPDTSGNWLWGVKKLGQSDLQSLKLNSYITWPLKEQVSGNGTISESIAADPGAAFMAANVKRYPGNTHLALTAVPKPGNHFVRWTGDCLTPTTLSTPPESKSAKSTSTAASAICNMVMDGSKNVGAIFEANPQTMKPIVVKAIGEAALLKHLAITSSLFGDTIRYPADLKGSAKSGSRVTLVASVPRKEAKLDWRNKDCDKEVQTHTVLRNIARCSFTAGNKANPHVLYVLKSA